ncbi:MAG: DUF5692 family protein [Patescibacteria group bacterium]
MSTLLVLLIALFFIALTMFSWAIEKTKWLFLAVFAIFPIFAVGFWVNVSHVPWPALVKFVTIVACALWLWIIRFTNWFSQKAIISIAYALLAINIGEVALMDAYAGNWVNAVAGVFLLFAIPSTNRIKLKTDEIGVKQFSWDLPWLWIASYTLWNWAFVANFYPQSIITQGAVLLAPLTIAALLGADHWAKARVYSLTLYLIACFTMAPTFALMDISPFALRPETLNLINGASLLLAVIAMVGRYAQLPRATPVRTSSGSRARSKAR